MNLDEFRIRADYLVGVWRADGFHECADQLSKFIDEINESVHLPDEFEQAYVQKIEDVRRAWYEADSARNDRAMEYMELIGDPNAPRLGE